MTVARPIKFSVVLPGTTGRTRHYIAGPPLDPQTGKPMPRGELPQAAVLILAEAENGGLCIYRYDRHGDFAGETWHLNVQELDHQIEFEYGEAAGPWQDLPELSGTDAIAFALRHIQPLRSS